jgi:hypothetical protein
MHREMLLHCYVNVGVPWFYAENCVTTFCYNWLHLVKRKLIQLQTISAQIRERRFFVTSAGKEFFGGPPMGHAPHLSTLVGIGSKYEREKG